MDQADYNQGDYYSDYNQPVPDATGEPVASDSKIISDENSYEDIKAKNRYRTPMFQPCKQMESTDLNGKRISIRVTEGKLMSGGLFAASYLLFRVRTEPVGYSIFRKDQDFYFLRKMITKMFPYMIVPPLPMKKKKESDKSIKRREKYFTRFL